jgi:hypothetical protein
VIDRDDITAARDETEIEERVTDRERTRVLAILDYYIARASNRLVDAGSNTVLRDIRAKVASGAPAP